ncbi:MAG: hypothetical protein HFH48_06590 [Lachnospiraceae bacterium]|nr:hypothetical protein [Lachnospiraceae bacterium]
MKKKIIYFVTLFLLLSVSGGCQKNESENFLLKESGEKESGREVSEPEESMKENLQEKKKIYVQVNGAVKNPGVYELEEGSRIFQAVELAGGITEEADAGALNQAEMLKDGQMIRIPRYGETEEQLSQMEGAGQEDGRVNLNTATEAELMTLPGIGTAKAKSILAWREENGSFLQVEDLMKIEGIKSGVFSKIKDSVKVD